MIEMMEPIAKEIMSVSEPWRSNQNSKLDASQLQGLRPSVSFNQTFSSKQASTRFDILVWMDLKYVHFLGWCTS